MHKDRFKGAGLFEDYLYTGVLKDSSKLLTEARNIGNSDEDAILDFQASIYIYDVSWCFFRFSDHPILVVIFKNNSMEVVHFCKSGHG